MNTEHTVSGVARWTGSMGGRIVRAWRLLPPERRLAAGAAIGLFVTLFLPWYQETVVVPAANSRSAVVTSLTGWGAFSFVEAAVLLVAGGVLTLLFQRAEGRAFHLPGGDGWVVMVAGGWACALVVWRIFDKQTTSVQGAGVTISGVEWGIFIALGVAVLLAVAGSRMRAAHRPEPPLPGAGGGARRRTGPPGGPAEPPGAGTTAATVASSPEPSPAATVASEPSTAATLASDPSTAATLASEPSTAATAASDPSTAATVADGPDPGPQPEEAEPFTAPTVAAGRPEPPAPSPANSSRRARGWLSARPRHLDERPPEE